MNGMDEEKQAKVESQLAAGMSKPASEADIEDVMGKKSIIEKLMTKLGDCMDDVKLLWDMLVDYKNGEYPKVPWKLIAGIVFFFGYLVTPTDVIPDVIPVLGFLDDGVVLKLVLSAFACEINAYKEWREGRPQIQVLLKQYMESGNYKIVNGIFDPHSDKICEFSQKN